MKRRVFLGGAVAAVAGPLAGAAEHPAPIRVVYHLADGPRQATRALRQIRNHLKAAPETRIVVVALGDGIDFLLQDAVDDGQYPYALLVEPLAAEGVEFRVCRNTLDARLIARDRLIEQAAVVSSGVAEIAALQAREGFVYLRP